MAAFAEELAEGATGDWYWGLPDDGFSEITEQRRGGGHAGDEHCRLDI